MDCPFCSNNRALPSPQDPLELRGQAKPARARKVESIPVHFVGSERSLIRLCRKDSEGI
ncbi:hypothetical protein SLEP1_g6502 [Rubroshorea leprosula]|uniref:Uncharacterized protein n=1 Tax=Rubroshorea leprosula TaxID=152421 RepID=A0AAV5I675_9ROSI|nr:hypothetical protein SLEP1_g6502 [Rubroshorea leprosula]